MSSYRERERYFALTTNVYYSYTIKIHLQGPNSLMGHQTRADKGLIFSLAVMETGTSYWYIRTVIPM